MDYDVIGSGKLIHTLCSRGLSSIKPLNTSFFSSSFISSEEAKFSNIYTGHIFKASPESQAKG